MTNMTMMNKTLIHRFKKDFGLSGLRWTRFCRRYGQRNKATVLRLIEERYGRVPPTFRKQFETEIQRGCEQDGQT